MIKKRDAFRCLLIGSICIAVITILIILKTEMINYNITGYAVFEDSKIIWVKDAKCEGGILSVSYSFDNSKVIGSSVSTDIWITDENGIEIKRIQDKFPINVDGLIERNVEIELENYLVRIYYAYLAPSFDLGNFVKQPVAYVDTTNPELSIREPGGKKTSRTGIPLEFFVSDDSPIDCHYNVSYSSTGGVVIENTKVENCEGTSFSVPVDSDYIIYLKAEDAAGNFNVVSSEFSVVLFILSEGDSKGGDFLDVNQTKELQVSKIGDIIAREGGKKTLSLNVKNTGNIFLNNCKLIVSGKISSWIYSTKIEGMAPGENVDFAFDLNVPEGIESKDYLGELEIKCDEASNVQKIVISMPESFGLVKIKDIEQVKDVLSINYDFDNSGLIGNSASVDVWIVDGDSIEIKRVQDVFAINKDAMIERSVKVELPEDLVGIYYVYFALSSDLDDFIRQSVVLGKSRATGFVVFDTTKGKIVVYIIFLLVIGVGIFFIWKRHGRPKYSKGE